MSVSRINIKKVWKKKFVAGTVSRKLAQKVKTNKNILIKRASS